MNPLLQRLWTQRLAPVFSLDLRSAALLRFVLGAVLLADTLGRLGDARAFYSDDGVLPRAAAVQVSGSWQISLHMANGATGFQILLILLQALAALALALGYRTRLATLAAWLLAVSIASRNPLVEAAGDPLMIGLLFWSLFLPLGARWSVDAALSEAPAAQDNARRSWASAALLLQALSPLFFGTLLKSAPEWWPQASAAHYVLSLDAQATAAGRWLAGHEVLARGIGIWAWWLGLLGPPLALLPLIHPRFNTALRRLVLVQLVLLQLGLIATLSLGNSPYVQLAALCALIGGGFWDACARRHALGQGLRIYYDRSCDFCLASCRLLRELLILPRAALEPAQDNRRAAALLRAKDCWVVIDRDDAAQLKWDALTALLRGSPLLRPLAWLAGLAVLRRPGERIYDALAQRRADLSRLFAALPAPAAPAIASGRGSRRLCALLLFAVLAWNLAAAQLLPPFVQRALSAPLSALRLDSRWDLFAPRPPQADAWWVAPGQLADGREVDVLQPGQAPSYDKPADLASRYGGFRWRAYQLALWQPGNAGQRAHWARYLCRSWNRGLSADDPQRLAAFKLVVLLEPTPAPGGPAAGIEQQVLLRQECPATQHG